MDRLEYIMWRDTIRYKYQLDKSLQLSEREIEEKIDELERTMSESMPYFFEGKDDKNIRNIIDHGMGFSYDKGIFVATQDDCQKWAYEKEILLFCGDAGNKVASILSSKIHNERKELSKEEYINRRKEVGKIIGQFYELHKYPLQSFKSIIKKFKTIEYYSDIDFTNFLTVKELFRDNQIYTYREFRKQNGYSTHLSRPFELPDGQKVCIFGYERSEFGYSEDDDIDLFDE